MQSPFLSSLRVGLWLLCAWPLLAQAGPADEFAAANRAQQAKLLQAWAAEPDAARLPLLQGLQQETVAIDGAKRAFIRQGDRYLPLEGEAAPVGEPKKVWLNNRLRILIANALSAQRLVSADAAVRLQAATALQREAQGEQLPLLTRRLAQEKDPQVRDALSIALANLQLTDASPQVRFNAVRLLGESGEPETRARLQALTDAAHEPDAAVRAEAQRSLQRVQHRLMIGDLLGQAFSGLSLGSILLLAALGLAITYGLLGVINMAHGEMLMLGAYSAYLVQGMFQQFAPQWLALYPLAALPVAFAITAGIGMLLERTVIRHLYGRPLETLLATWGISLVLIQLVRVLFGAQNVEVANPAWLSGGVQLLPEPGAAVEPHRGDRVRAVGAGADLAAAEQDPARHERARGDAKPRDGGLLRRAHRAGGHAGLRVGIRHRRARRGGAVAVGQRRAGAGARLHHRFVPGGGARRRRPTGGDGGGGLRPRHRQQDPRAADRRRVGQDPDPGADRSVYSKASAGAVRPQGQGD